MAIRGDERGPSVLVSGMCHFELPKAGRDSGNLWMEDDEGFVFSFESPPLLLPSCLLFHSKHVLIFN